VAYIEPNSLETLERRLLFYPAAGDDWSEFLELFADYVDEFHFTDITYQFDKDLESPFGDSSAYRKVESDFDGDQPAQIELRRDPAGRDYSYVEPGRLTELYERKIDGRRFKVIRRRGFGQYSLAKFPNQSIGVFVHRGDSPGESGSNVYFLANRKRDHEPVSDLFNKLACKLADHALIISDGSNVGPKFLKKFHNKNISGTEASTLLNGKHFYFGEFDWKCVGYVERRYGPTLVWDVTRKKVSVSWSSVTE